MAEYTVGVVGTGAAPGGTEETGHAMGYRHGDAYAALDSCELVACADVVSENANSFAEGVAHVVDCLDSAEEPLLSARRALTGTELIFGVYESARRRGRVDLPLDITDNPLVAMVESGALDPRDSDE